MSDLVVPAGSAPERLDIFVARHLQGTSRQRAVKLIAEGAVRLNGRRRPKGALVQAGDVVNLAYDASKKTALQANPDLDIPVLYADDVVVAVDKPAGRPSHALRPHERETVANFLLARFPEMRSIGNTEGEAGLVHRLDTGTSGVLLAARTSDAYAKLRRQFSAAEILKEYLALVVGDVAKPGEIRIPLAHDRRHPGRMRLCPDAVSARTLRARPAVTRYRPLQRTGTLTLVAVEIPTGVTHQIRAHLASMNHPIVGDTLYGGSAAPRPMLHATRITFRHPSTGRRLRVESPLPTDVKVQMRVPAR